MNKAAPKNDPAEAELVLVNSEHWYHIPGDEVSPYYVSVTTILRTWAKGKGYDIWLQNHSGEEVEQIMDAAGTRGSKVHAAIELLLKGEQVDPYSFEFVDDEGMKHIGFTNDERRMVASFQRFWYEEKPKVFAVEYILYNSVHKYAGKCDFIGMIGDDLVILDWKTSKGIYVAYEAQVAAYAACFLQMFGKPIKRAAILRLGTRHKKGYELKYVDSISRAYKAFLGIQDAWRYENPTFAPKFIELPRAYKLPKIEYVELNPVVVPEERTIETVPQGESIPVQEEQALEVAVIPKKRKPRAKKEPQVVEQRLI